MEQNTSWHISQKAIKENPDTENHGKKWTTEETNELLKEIKDDISFKDIALIHKRTMGSVRGKLFQIAEYLMNHKNMPIDKVSETIGLSVDVIMDHFLKKPPKASALDYVFNDSISTKFYAVKVGRVPGLYKTWEECKEQIDKFSGAKFKTFTSKIAAETYINDNQIQEPELVIHKEIKLNYDQQCALDSFKAGKNIFLTGPAGTGKSVTLKKIIEHCECKNIKIGVTATTGSAAFLIGGKTMHSFLGIGLGKGTPESMYQYIRDNKKMLHFFTRLRELQVLIIDEVSMLDNELFNKISMFLGRMRKNDKPFGGLQVILTGDFCQLEPVDGDYCFKASEWERLNLDTIYLRKLIRQDGDSEFQGMLEKLRYGKCSNKTLERLESLKGTKFDNVKPTILYSHNQDVNAVNKKEYDLLINSGAKKQTYKVIFPPKETHKKKAETWFKNLEIPESVELCVGAQVVITSNINQEFGIVNGTRGVVIDVFPKHVDICLVNGASYRVEHFQSVSADDENVTIAYMPLKLAYALTIHKCQGMTLDAVEVDLGKVFAAGQGYTAISRAKNLKSIKVKSVSKNSFLIKESVLEFYKSIENTVLEKSEQYVNKLINTMIFRIVNHMDLDNCLNFVYEFVPEEDLEFWDTYKYPAMELELLDYDIPELPVKVKTDDDRIDMVVINTYKIKDNMITDMDNVINLMKEHHIIL